MEQAVPCTEILHTSSETTVKLRGVLDAAVAHQVHQAALEAAASGNNIVVCFSEAERLEAAPLQVLLSLQNGLAARGMSLRWSSVPETIGKYLDQAGIASWRESR